VYSGQIVKNIMTNLPGHPSRKSLFAGTRMGGLFFAALLLPAFAIAEPNIQLTMEVAKEVVVEENGQVVTNWIEAEDVLPGEKLRYTVNYINIGDEAATDVRIENPIPELSVYVLDSAIGEGTQIVYSADGGESYDPAGEVTFEVNVFGGGTDRRDADEDQYTNIRWLVEQIDPGSSGIVSFQVLVQ
jgi:uncharacterized repeat protein (TIGR01451 family)